MRALFVVLVATAGLYAASARAQSSPDARARAAARDLFDRGLTCVDRADWACAVDAFGRARALHPSSVILTNYAVALEHVGRLVEASEAYRQILRDRPGVRGRPALRERQLRVRRDLVPDRVLRRLELHARRHDRRVRHWGRGLLVVRSRHLLGRDLQRLQPHHVPERLLFGLDVRDPAYADGVRHGRRCVHRVRDGRRRLLVLRRLHVRRQQRVPRKPPLRRGRVRLNHRRES